MSSAENGRLVWLTQEQRDFMELVGYGELLEIRDAWDAAPADPVEAARAVIRLMRDESALDIAGAVLAAIGVPQRPTPRDETPS